MVVKDTLRRTETTLGRQDEVAKELKRQNVNVDIEEVRRRMRLWIISNTNLRTELDSAVREVLPLSPRGAKRMINHAHLLLDIGVGRRVFGTPPGLRPVSLRRGSRLPNGGHRWQQP
jgi:hypothetical protein